MEDSLASARGAGEKKDLDSTTRVAGNHQVLRRSFVGDHFGQVENADAAFRLTVFVQHHRVARLPIGAARLPWPAVLRLDGFDLPQHFPQKRSRVGADRRVYEGG